MNLEDFLVMIGLILLFIGYLENTLRYTTPLQKFLKLFNDPGLNLLEMSRIFSSLKASGMSNSNPAQLQPKKISFKFIV